MRTAVALAIVIAALAVSIPSLGVTTVHGADAPGPALTGSGEQSGELVTIEELCAFRAPLALTGETVLPSACDETVALLQRLAEADPSCFELWLATGAMPPCAAAYIAHVP
jgi:hypothetical protein